jgi:lipopolysaccharide transport system ATP-binding protein
LSTVVKVENLGKSYRLQHLQSSSRYTTLRDVVTQKMKNAFTKGKNGQESSELFWALKDVSFEVKDGERIGIIGRNGAGKSTLLKILSRITDPTGGRISIKGRVASLLEVGTGFHPELSGRENIFLNGAILGMSRWEIKSRFDEIVTFAEVEKFLDTPVKRYSSGMYVRLAFAVAAHLQPEILIVDEVLAVGDAQFQKKCLGKMQDVSKNEGRTILFVSHHMAAIQNLCNKSIYLKDGRIEKLGNTEDVIGYYLESTNFNLETKLENRTDRKGNGAIRFTNVELKNERGKHITAFQCGSDGNLSVQFKVNVERINKFHFSVGIDDESGQRITVLNNEATNDLLSDINKDNGVVEIHIRKIPLRKGKYTYTLYSTIDGELADWIQNAGSFSVESGDFYKTGKLPPEGQGSILMDHNFQYNS